jgi:hypothetical protein
MELGRREDAKFCLTAAPAVPQDCTENMAARQRCDRPARSQLRWSSDRVAPWPSVRHCIFNSLTAALYQPQRSK